MPGPSDSSKQQPKDKVPKEKKKSHMSADEYNRITRILALRLKTMEEQAQGQQQQQSEGTVADDAPGASDDDVRHVTAYRSFFKGCQWKDLVQWYLTEVPAPC